MSDGFPGGGWMRRLLTSYVETGHGDVGCAAEEFRRQCLDAIAH